MYGYYCRANVVSSGCATGSYVVVAHHLSSAEAFDARAGGNAAPSHGNERHPAQRRSSHIPSWEDAAPCPCLQAHPCLRVAPAAQQQAAGLAARLAEMQAVVKPLVEDEGCKKQRRDIEKKLTVHVQQICGTQTQVRLDWGHVTGRDVLYEL